MSLLGALLRGCLALALPILQNSAQAHVLTGAPLMFNPLLCLVCVSHSAPSDSLRPHALVAPGSSVRGVLQARILEWVAILFSRDLPNPGIEPRSLALWADSLPFFTSAIKKPTLSAGGSLLLLTLIKFCSFIINFANSEFFQSVQGFHSFTHSIIHPWGKYVEKGHPCPQMKYASWSQWYNYSKAALTGLKMPLTHPGLST